MPALTHLQGRHFNFPRSSLISPKDETKDPHCSYMTAVLFSFTVDRTEDLIFPVPDHQKMNNVSICWLTAELIARRHLCGKQIQRERASTAA